MWYIHLQEKKHLEEKTHQSVVTWTFLKDGVSALHVNHLHFYKGCRSFLSSADILIK